jgi:hypothetical protein
MTDDEDWIMQPVLEGLCKYESLIDGTLGLADIDRMNDAIDVRAENQARVEEAMEDSRRGR